MNNYNFYFASQEQTESFAKELYPFLTKIAQEEVVLLYLLGDLGAGKSTFSRAFIRASGYQGNIPSPTYSLQESYSQDNLTLHHLDLYRLGDFSELEMLGFFDNLEKGNLFLVEWPQLLSRQFESYLTFHFNHNEDLDSRSLTIELNPDQGYREELLAFLSSAQEKFRKA